MKKPLILILSAWIAHAVAWFLPAGTLTFINDNGIIVQRVMGWRAFWTVLESVLAIVLGLDSDQWYWTVLAAISVISTVFFVLGSPWLLMRHCVRFRRCLGWAALGAFATNAYFFLLPYVEHTFTLGLGYYLWWASFLVLGIGLIWLARETKSSQLQAVSCA